MIGAYMHNCTAVPRWFKFSVSVRDVNGTLKHTAEVSTKRMEPESGWGLASFCSKHTLTKVRACVGLFSTGRFTCSEAKLDLG